MIKEKLEQLHTEITLHSKSFGGERKQGIRENIRSFMEAYPISLDREGAVASPFSSDIVTSHNRFRLSFLGRMRVMTGILIVALTLGGSVSYAAQDSVPGDSLYGVKTNVNENLRSLLTFSSKQEASLHLEFAEERIKETEKLLARGAIEPKIAEELNVNFKKQAEAVDAKIEELASENKHEDALEISSKFESSLKAHESVLGELNDKNASTTNATSTVGTLLGSVENQIDSTEEARATAEKRIKTDAIIEKETAQAKMQLAKDAISEVSTLIEQLEESKLIEKSNNEAETRLKKAQRSYSSGRGRYLRESFSYSYVLFEQANQEAEQAKTYLTTIVSLDTLNKEATDSSVATSTPSMATTTEAIATSTEALINATSTTATTTDSSSNEATTSSKVSI
ncbi:MAG: DUF5667 domain-containing protein [Candidatus Taylorbacteria bacterium]